MAQRNRSPWGRAPRYSPGRVSRCRVRECRRWDSPWTPIGPSMLSSRSRLREVGLGGDCWGGGQPEGTELGIQRGGPCFQLSAPGGLSPGFLSCFCLCLGRLPTFWEVPHSEGSLAPGGVSPLSPRGTGGSGERSISFGSWCLRTQANFP